MIKEGADMNNTKRNQENTLQAVLDRAKKENVKVIKKPIKSTVSKQVTPKKIAAPKETEKGRINTVLIGGHFSPEVSKQLRIIAAEETTTNQKLLKEALDLLFTKKGKKLIADL